MLDDSARNEVQAAARTVSILILALSAGVLAFAAYVLLVYQPDQEREAGLLTPLSFGFFMLQILLSMTVPRAIQKANRKRIADRTWQMPSNRRQAPETDAGKLAAVYQMTTIVSCAFLESSAFLSLFAYMLEGHFSSLVTAGVMLVGILSSFPTTDRLIHWVEQELRAVNDDRAAASSR